MSKQPTLTPQDTVTSVCVTCELEPKNFKTFTIIDSAGNTQHLCWDCLGNSLRNKLLTGQNRFLWKKQYSIIECPCGKALTLIYNSEGAAILVCSECSLNWKKCNCLTLINQ